MLATHRSRFAQALLVVVWTGTFVLRSGAETTGERPGNLSAASGPVFGNSVYNPSQVEVTELGNGALWIPEPPGDGQPQVKD